MLLYYPAWACCLPNVGDEIVIVFFLLFHIYIFVYVYIFYQH